jgi:DHA3 family macrolide efflux protein-like MFS transporter
MEQPVVTKGMRTFVLIALAQFVSITGSLLSSFALGIWVYQKTGSATELAFITLFATLPNILISPLAGTLVDRWDRRKTIILSECGLSLTILALALLLQLGRLAVWEIYLVTAINSIILAFLRPAYAVITPLLVPKEQLGRAMGIGQATFAAGQLIGPILAGVLVTTIKIQGVLLIDYLSFFFPIITLLSLRIPQPERTAEAAGAQGSLWREARYGWSYLQTRPGLLGLLVLLAIVNFSAGIITVLVTPLVLSFSTPIALGTLNSIAGVGLLGGSVAMGIWGGPKRRIRGVIGFMLLCGFFIALGGLRASIPLLTVAAFGYFFSLPLITGCTTAIWQSKIAPDVQGRALAISSMVMTSTLPVAALIAGPLADKVFEPLLVKGGLLASTVGQIIGVGTGRGIGLMFIIVGLLTLIFTLMGFLNPRIRLVEDELPDMLPGTVSIPTEEAALSPVSSAAGT